MFDLMQYALIFYDFQLILARMPDGPHLSPRKAAYGPNLPQAGAHPLPGHQC